MRSPHRVLAWLLAALACALLGPEAEPAPDAPAAGDEPTRIEHEIDTPWLGDLDGMLERRRIRVLVVPSRTFYFVDKGTQRGLAHDQGKAFEEELNQKRGRKQLYVDVVFVPVAYDDVLPALIQGRGDIAIANLTITPERKQWVDFSAPFWTGVNEIAVTGPASPPLDSLDGLAGQKIFVRYSSSYFQSLWHLNQWFAQSGKQPVLLDPAPQQLQDEDLLEMVAAGLLPVAIVDDFKAEFWQQILPALVLHRNVSVRTSGEIAWAFRKDSPKLRAAVDDFARRHGRGTAFGNAKFREYLKSTKYVRDATSQAELAKLLRTLQLFQKYAAMYDFDWLMLAAQGYQESRLDQQVKSRVGAVGVMQVMPATGKELGVGDIRQIEPNIHAGTKYLRKLIDDYFPDAHFDDLNRCLFAFAAYNAGPGRVAGLRRQAARRGLDPDVWFENVERIAAEQVGQEPVRYVGNIFKYYIAYQLVVEQQQAREKALHDTRAP
jgi:membrane-bound lytic murein transglycosylase MltF